MSNLTFEILFIVLLIIANGVFAMSEIAIISARKARLHSRPNTRASASARACSNASATT